MNSITAYEIKAYAFYLMTGYMAPGKDAPAAAGSTDMEQRNRAWQDWMIDNRECIHAMIKSFEHITRE